MGTIENKEIFNPLFSIEDVELCHIRNWVEFRIDVLFFENDDQIPHMIKGKVNGVKGWEKIEWNERGEAMIMGMRIKDYDLIRTREQQKAIKSSKTFLIALLILVAVIIYLIISKWI